MLHRWKFILTNWINCYFNESSKKEQCVNVESLLTIISHLRDNLNLDESKSSTLEANTIEEFITEKYPDFKFENGTIEASSEEEIHIVASLLLFFVCVNSKDVDMKTAMCSKLSSDDQEIILKFSKCLMECSPIMYKDVHAAITEACGLDIAAGGKTPSHTKVTETPPALRSLHSEVRRLQAALDAERFDRNYLQDELARTNIQLEKLMKDKEQYKLDIVNLKAKISMCCGQEAEVRGGDAAAETSTRLTRQLQDLEERLVATKEQLDDVQYERDTYKYKIGELKQERDKWLALSQQETSRAGQLADELDTERRHVQTLKELVTELRQHHQNNCFDSSQLECDDPDASIHSLQNASVSSEACANVIEVQLGEERAKIVVLKQQIQALQEQLINFNKQAEDEKLSLQAIISERETEIFNLKHRINEEIEEKDNLKSHFSDEFIKLNNEINELEQKLKDNAESSRVVIEQKIEDIQTLQEEKLSLLQSLSDETTKLNNVIKDLEITLDTEKNQKLKMKDDYENQIMKLNEKVLNRNNELVELQNNVFEKSEMIERLHLELRKERELKEKLSNKYHLDIDQLKEEKNAIEMKLHQKTEESKELQRRLLQNVAVFEEFNKEIDDLKVSNANLSDSCKILKETKASLFAEIQNRDRNIEEIQKELENIRNILREEKNNFERALSERNDTINSLQVQLHNEIHYKTELLNDHANLQQVKVNLCEEVKMLNSELTQVKKEIHEKDRMIYAIDLYLKEEKHANKILKLEYEGKTEALKQLTLTIAEKDNEIKVIQEKLANESRTYQEEIFKRDELIKSLNDKLSSEIIERNCQQKSMDFLITEKDNEIRKIQDEFRNIRDALEKELREKDESIDSLNEKVMNEISEKNILNETLKTQKANEIEKIQNTLECTKKAYEEEIVKRDKLILSINEKLESIIAERKILDGAHLVLKEEKEIELNTVKDKLENAKMMFKEEICKKDEAIGFINEQLATEIAEKIYLQNQLSSLKEEKENEIKIIQDKLENDCKNFDEELNKQDEIIKTINENLASEIRESKSLQNKLDLMKSEKDLLDKKLNQKCVEMSELQTDYEKLSQITEKNNSLIEALEKKLEAENEKYSKLEISFDSQTSSLMAKLNETEKYLKESKANYKNIIDEKNLQIETYKIQIDELQKNIDNYIENINRIEKEKEALILKLQEELTYKNTFEKEYQNQSILLDTVTSELNAEISMQNQEIATLKAEIDSLSKKVEGKSEDAFKEFELRNENEKLLKELETQKENSTKLINTLQSQLKNTISNLETVESQNNDLTNSVQKYKNDIAALEEKDNELKIKIDSLEYDLFNEMHELTKLLKSDNGDVENSLLAKLETEKEIQDKVRVLSSEIVDLLKANSVLVREKHECILQSNEEKEIYSAASSKAKEEIEKLKNQVIDLSNENEENKNVISNLELLIKHEIEQNQKLRDDYTRDKMALDNKCSLLQEYQIKTEKQLEEKDRQIYLLKENVDTINSDCAKHWNSVINTYELNAENLEAEIKTMKTKLKTYEQNLQDKNDIINKVAQEKDAVINTINTELINERTAREKYQRDLDVEITTVYELKHNLEEAQRELIQLKAIRKENDEIIKALEQQEISLKKEKEIDVKTIENKLESMSKAFDEEIRKKDELIRRYNEQIHSLKDKLIDKENSSDKMSKTYECQIENLNVMVNKLTCYLKEKTVDLETLRKEKERLQQIVDDNAKVTKSLIEEVKLLKQREEKQKTDFESERLVLKNMVTVTESVMEDQKMTLNKVITEYLKANETLQDENKELKHKIEIEKKNAETKLQEKDVIFATAFKELAEVRNENEKLIMDMESQKENSNKEISALKSELKKIISSIETLELRNKDLTNLVQKYKNDIAALEEKDNELKIKKDSLEFELLSEIDELMKVLKGEIGKNEKLKCTLQEKLQTKIEIQDKVRVLSNEIVELVKVNSSLEREKHDYILQLNEAKVTLDTATMKANEEIEKLKHDKVQLESIIEENKKVISNLELLIKHELEQNQKLRDDFNSEKLNLENKCSLLQEYQIKTENHLKAKDNEIYSLKENVDTINSNCAKHWNSIIKTYQTNVEKLEKEIESLNTKLKTYEKNLKEKDDVINKVAQEKDAVISTINTELINERAAREKYQRELDMEIANVYGLRHKLEEAKNELEQLNAIRKENDEMVKAVGKLETFNVASQERASSNKYSGPTERDHRDRHQVSTPTSDLTHSSIESLKTITDLEKIIHDKNRTITTLQSDITYLKSLMADSENKLLDVAKELEVSKEACEQLSSQLKKIVQQKNEEIAELKKQVSKMSVTENRATQIIKVSAKYQAIILKRIAEIKSNTILKELTNFGNSANCDNELRRSLSSGAVTMEDLENFLETTDRHLKRCSEKQLALQKERDRLMEVNRINESEILNMKKFLTELSISFKTFSSVKELYAQKLSKIVLLQRTVRREILSLEGLITDAMMCKLERGYAAVMQDLSECAMNLERWVERCVSRTISAEKIKQAFTSDDDRTSLATSSFQNASLEVQLGELENSFTKLLEDVACAQKGEGAKDAQSTTVMEVRAEYEDKLNRMKAKMKELYREQIAVFTKTHRDKIECLEKELQKAHDKLAESSRAYEEHIRSLTTELWSVGEKFLMKKDEAEWLRKKQYSGSLMSLQHVHSSGLVPPQEIPSRPSDSHSLRSLPVNTQREKRDKQGRGLHMSDEEGEVFDNRWLKELSATPRRESVGPGQRLSELRWRNSLCPPHLKSSYPAETQFASALDEEDIKCVNVAAAHNGKQQRKEVGITAYKKPGPPTPSKQAGRLSATDSELRESLRMETDPHPSRKTSTPSRIRAFFRSARQDTIEDGTPRRRLSNIFRKK